MQNFKSVVHFLLVDFGGGYLLLTCCDGGETKSTPSPTDFDCTIRLDWSLTKYIIHPQPTSVKGQKSSTYLDIDVRLVRKAKGCFELGTALPQLILNFLLLIDFQEDIEEILGISTKEVKEEPTEISETKIDTENIMGLVV